MRNGNRYGLELAGYHPLAFLQEEALDDRRNLKIALLIALLLHIGLVFLVLPEVPTLIKKPKKKEARPFDLIVPPPPDVDDVILIDHVKPIPVPDPTPDDPEPRVPVIEVKDVPGIGPDVRLTRDDIVPPQPPDVVDADQVGLTMPQVDWSSIQRNLTYPPMGISTRTQGYVEVRAILRSDGTVDQIEVVGGDLQFKWFREAAVNAVKKARFIPGVLYGRAVDVRMVLKIHFRLN